MYSNIVIGRKKENTSLFSSDDSKVNYSDLLLFITFHRDSRSLN